MISNHYQCASSFTQTFKLWSSLHIVSNFSSIYSLTYKPFYDSHYCITYFQDIAKCSVCIMLLNYQNIPMYPYYLLFANNVPEAERGKVSHPNISCYHIIESDLIWLQTHALNGYTVTSLHICFLNFKKHTIKRNKWDIRSVSCYLWFLYLFYIYSKFFTQIGNNGDMFISLLTMYVQF